MDPLYDNLFEDYDDEDLPLPPVRKYRPRFDFDSLSDREVVKSFGSVSLGPKNFRAEKFSAIKTLSQSFRLRRDTILTLNGHIQIFL
jgi:hypothetical protein